MKNKYSGVKKNEKCVVLVEGRDDRIVVEKILQKFEIKGVLVIDSGGKDDLLRDFMLVFKVSGAERVGVVIDADTNLKDRWKAIRDRVNWDEFGVDRIDTPDHAGTIITRDPQPGKKGTRLGIWLMPDNEATGELENFLEEMIPSDERWELAIDYVDRAKQMVEQSGKQDEWRIDMPKANIHAWMAIVKPGRLSGTAIEAGEMEVSGEICGRFVDWIKKLCS